jgi:hypothetical protein
MPRKPAPIPPYKLKVSLPQDLMGRLTLDLWSDVEGRAPLGAYSEFVTARLREYYSRERLDLATIIPGLQPGVHVVTGDKESVAILRRHYATQS